MKSENSYRYSVYGITLRSEVPLALPEVTEPGFSEIELCCGSPLEFAKIAEEAGLSPTSTTWNRLAHLKNGSAYLRWEGLAEFLVSADGFHITFGWNGPVSWEAFQVYLLGQALSFALVKQGHEPLHATSVVVDGKAVAFLGHSGFGKSSLAAYFLRAGHQLLTDDVLVIRETQEGFCAYPGPPRIKLFPHMARRHFGKSVTGPPMNPGSEKQVIALEPHQRCATHVPVGVIYALTPPGEVARKQWIRIVTLTAQQAFVALVANTFNRLDVGPNRLYRQFHETTRLADMVPVRKLVYPRRRASFPLVHEAILADLRRKTSEVAPCGV